MYGRLSNVIFLNFSARNLIFPEFQADKVSFVCPNIIPSVYEIKLLIYIFVIQTLKQ